MARQNSIFWTPKRQVCQRRCILLHSTIPISKPDATAKIPPRSQTVATLPKSKSAPGRVQERHRWRGVQRRRPRPVGRWACVGLDDPPHGHLRPCAVPGSRRPTLRRGAHASGGLPSRVGGDWGGNPPRQRVEVRVAGRLPASMYQRPPLIPSLGPTPKSVPQPFEVGRSAMEWRSSHITRFPSIRNALLPRQGRHQRIIWQLHGCCISFFAFAFEKIPVAGCSSFDTHHGCVIFDPFFPL